MAKQGGKLDPGIHRVPREIDNEVGRLKLLSMDIKIDSLTDEQVRYNSSWQTGT
jgi:adenosylhomocysteinase